jgi:hypothetical protein
MDSELRRASVSMARCCGSSTWEGFSASPGPHQQGKLAAMSGHIATRRDGYVEVLDMPFNPDAAPSSANMTMDLEPSQNLLTCRLTKAVWWYRRSRGEGSIDSQSLFGRLGWLEQIANPSPLGRQGNSRAKWVGKTGVYRSSGARAFVEWSSAVHGKTSEIGVGDAPTGRSDLRRLNPLNELSPATTLSGMRRLIDSDKSPACSLLVSHLCSYRRGRSVGALSSVRRAGRLRIANGHAGNRVSDIHEGLGRRGTNFTTSSTRVCARRVMSPQRPVPAFSDGNASGLDPQGVAVLTDEMSCPAGLDRANKDSPSGASRGHHGFLAPPGTHGVPRQGDVPIWSSVPREPEARAGHVRSTDVAVLPGGALQPAPSGPHQQGPPLWERPGSKQGPPWVPGQRRRVDPQALFGRLACGERVANPTPASSSPSRR